MTEGTSVQFLAGVAILEIQDGIWKKPKRDDEIRFLSQDDAVSFSMRDKPIPMRFNAEDQMMNHGHSFVKRHHLKVAFLTFKISRELKF